MRRTLSAAVRTTLSALLTGLLVTVTSADRLECPDGCTEEAPGRTASQEAPSSCALCQGWSGSPVVAVWRPSPHEAARRPSKTSTPAAPALPTIEPPPKAA